MKKTIKSKINKKPPVRDYTGGNNFTIANKTKQDLKLTINIFAGYVNNKNNNQTRIILFFVWSLKKVSPPLPPYRKNLLKFGLDTF